MNREVEHGAGCTYCFYKDGRNGWDNRFCKTCNGGRNMAPGKPETGLDVFYGDKCIDEGGDGLSYESKSACHDAATYGMRDAAGKHFSYCVFCGKNQGRY